MPQEVSSPEPHFSESGVTASRGTGRYVPAMPEDTPKPIMSTRETDPSAQEAIDQFVVTLAEQVDALQDADLEGDLDLLGDLARKLAERAEDLGYAPLVAIATVVSDACRDQKIEDAVGAMVDLTQISTRIRKGHRGSA